MRTETTALLRTSREAILSEYRKDIENLVTDQQLTTADFFRAMITNQEQFQALSGINLMDFIEHYLNEDSKL